MNSGSGEGCPPDRAAKPFTMAPGLRCTAQRTPIGTDNESRNPGAAIQPVLHPIYLEIRLIA